MFTRVFTQPVIKTIFGLKSHQDFLVHEKSKRNRPVKACIKAPGFLWLLQKLLTNPLPRVL
jgi:hypothetical protein